MELLTFALLGIGVGALYGVIAQGLVLIYRGSGVLNFAQGGFLMVGAYVFYELHVQNGWSYALALIVTILICAAMGAAVHILILRPMRAASAVSRVIATLGVMALLNSIGILIYQDDTLSMPASLPSRTIAVLPGIHIGLNLVIIFGIGAALTAALWLTYRFTSFGRVTTAVAENQLAASITGHSPDAVAAINWALGAALAAVAGVLIAPIDYLQVTTLILLIIPAIGAGLLGGFRSFPLAFLGGLILGVAQSVAGLYITNAEFSLSLPFILIIVYLFVRGRALPLRSYVLERLPSVGSGRIHLERVLPLVAAVGVILFLVPNQWSTAITATLTFAIITLSVVVITGYAGQLSLAQYVMGGIGALVGARLSAYWHFPFVLAVLGAMVATGVVGAALALPSLRSRGISLAIATLAASTVFYDLILNNTSIDGGNDGITQKNPTVFGWNLNPQTHPGAYGLATLIFLAIFILVVTNIRRGAAGRRMLAVRSNERAAAALGVNVYQTKVYAFTVASAIAGAGGVLFAFLSPVVLAGNFDQITSINFVTVTVVGGVGYIGGALIGATLIPGGLVSQIFFNVQNINTWIPLVGAVGLLLVLRKHSGGIFEMNREQLDKLTKKWRARRVAAQTDSADTTLTTAEPAANGSSPVLLRVEPKELQVERIRVAFGGVVAVDEVSLTVRPGEIHGLIGPNGAGKTTLIDAVTGFAPVSAGTIKVGGVEVTRWSARKRSRGGIARSFQSLELFNDLTVRENLAVGCDKGGLLPYLTDIVHPRAITLGPLVLDAMRQSGLHDILDLTPDSLPFGRRRLVAIMRALASEPSVLLLDEPAAGLSDEEARHLGTLIQSLAKDRGIAVLLVEHNLDMVMAISDQMTVLTTGSVLVEGVPSQIITNPAVIDAYVGEDVEEVVA